MLENKNIRQISTDVYELTGNIYPDKTIKEFTGKLYGNGHSIIGVNYPALLSNQRLLR